MTTAGVILNGGHSSRMGQAKGMMLMPDGRTALAWVAAALSLCCNQILVVGGHAPTPEQLPLTHNYHPDDEPDCGPIGGLATVARLACADAFLIASCDQSLIARAPLARLRSANSSAIRLFQSTDPADFFPFPGWYPLSILRTHVLEATHRPPSLKQLLLRVDVEYVPISPAVCHFLTGANTPVEFAELARRSQSPDAAD
jgi:molybdopterin-guanine dinucleotide biosynthesis protein A